jgi:hypothetical protein
LTFDQGQLTRINLAFEGKNDIEFGKNGQSEWTIVQPQPYRADNFQVEELLRKLNESKMDLTAKAEDTEKAAKSFSSGKPVATVKLTDSTGVRNPGSTQERRRLFRQEQRCGRALTSYPPISASKSKSRSLSSATRNFSILALVIQTES